MIALWALIATLSAAAPPSGFPHQVHTRYFPVCEGCHSGIVTGVAAQAFPAAQECASCHDGVTHKRVQPSTRAARATNLRFSHVGHRQATQRRGAPPRCQVCHATGSNPSRMSIAPARPASCMVCHAQPGETHLSATMPCRTCHVAIAEAPAVTLEVLRDFPRPEWHGAPDFLAEHGRGVQARGATCTVCHARETCERCHANGNQVPLIMQLARDTRVATLEAGKPARYYAPVSHTRDWSVQHPRQARAQIATCANCHLQSSCASCHQSGSRARPVIALLPAVPPNGTGKASVMHIERRVHASDVVRSHGSRAATNRRACEQCHARQQCAGCHAGPDARRLHAVNYAERHAADVFASSSRCQSCHNTETFCRSCHAGSGVAADARMNAAFHNAQPLWILAHGQAARTGLDACVACHRQTDCTRCHSASGGWGVSPHRAGFAASRMAARSAVSCRLCHLVNPLKGN